MNKKFYLGIPVDNTGATFRISKDNLLAYVEGVNHDNLLPVCDKINPLIQECGITYGLLDPPEMDGNRLIVARGKKPKDGIDGKIEIVANSYLEHKEEKGPEERDPRNLALINNVNKGEILAKRIHPTPGEPGIDIFGQPVPPRPGRWISFKLGNLVELINEDTMAAAESGALVIDDDGTISVTTEWTIDGDVDFSTGHVEFYGDKLTIKGSVRGGFTVEANGDLTIGCNIEDETIVLAGGDVTVKGIIRSQNTMVKTGGDLRCSAIEYARVFVGQNLLVKDYILNGGCQVHGKVSLTGTKGLVAGGQILAGGSIKVKTAGTSAHVATHLSAGRDPLLDIHYEGLIKEQEALSKKLEKIEAGLQKLGKVCQNRSKADAKIETIKKSLEEAARIILKQMESNREKIGQLENNLGAMDQATITVLEKAYPNVTIKICDTSITLKEIAKGLVFFFKNGEIAARTLE
ncbi:MAG: DUF342 domain-containing protein [Thermodesulfobacteria bacterium]|nr:DUF342 domain-containing protein [Thermodesulfobacteriota bacterium]